MCKKRDIVCFSIPYPETKRGKLDWNRRFSLNAYWSGKHPMVRSKDSKYIHMLTREALKRHGVKQTPFKVPVEITFYWNDRLDIDNHAALGKMIVDAMKKYVIVDDNPQRLKRVTHEFWDGQEIGVEVRAL